MALERCQSLSEEEKEKKKRQYSRDDTKIYQKMKNRSLSSIERNIIKWERTPCYNEKKLFSFRKSGIVSGSILKSNDLETSFDEKQIKSKY